MLRDVFRTRASEESQCSRIAAPSAAFAGRGRSGGALLPRRRRGRSPVRDEAPRAVGLPRPEREVFAVEAITNPDGSVDRLYSKYLTLWARQADGAWRFIADGGASSPSPGQ